MSAEVAAEHPPVEELAPENAEAAPEDFGFGKKKKPKKKKKEGEEGAAEDVKVIDGTGAEFVRGEVYKYEDLLKRVQDFITAANPGLGNRKKFTIKPPIVGRAGAKKSDWSNFMEICKLLNRPHEHVLQFVLSELGTEGAISGENHLILKGKIDTKGVESLLRKYIKEYVTCKMCNSSNTTVDRDSQTRLFMMKCAACGAHRSVQTIRAGFHAQTRADRKKAKEAA
eukprot:GDKH01015501.1.p2 GENE.GDKH01015501.1~~GDKH01015501.1.p2  ORF type:complete len:226 (-),score=57.34 GDKH01015501.1:103-780(-)